MHKCLALGALAVFSAVSISAQGPELPKLPDAASALKLPTIQKRQLSNGLPVGSSSITTCPSSK